jgi:hypothetical protein
MITGKYTHPERDLYYLGGKVIEILASSEQAKYDYFDLFARLKADQDIKMGLYVLVLDWLFLIGVIKNSDQKYIEKCF